MHVFYHKFFKSVTDVAFIVPKNHNTCSYYYIYFVHNSNAGPYYRYIKQMRGWPVEAEDNQAIADDT